MVLESLSKRIKKNDENVDNGTIGKWKQQLLEIAQHYDELKERIQLAQTALNNDEVNQALQQLNDGEVTYNNKLIEQLCTVIDKDIENSLQRKNQKEGPVTKNIAECLGFATKQNKRKSDDFEIIEAEETERDYICPFSGSRMQQPMKK